MPKHIDLKVWNSRPIEDELEMDANLMELENGELRAETERFKKVFTKLANLMRHYEVPAEIGKIIIEEAGK